MKKKVKCTALILIAIFIWSLCLAKYLDPQSGIAVNSVANAIVIKVPCLPHLSSYLNGYELHLGIYNNCTFALLAVIAFWRIILMNNFWKKHL